MIARIPTIHKALLKLPVDACHPRTRKWKLEDRYKAKQPQSKFKDGLATTAPVSRDKNRTKQGWGYSSVTELLLSICKASGSVSGNPKTKPN